MSLAVVMTMGTGTGNKEVTKSLAGALKDALIQRNPNAVYFVCTKESRETAETISKELKSIQIEYIGVEEKDDPNKLCDALKARFKEIRKTHDNVILDYTSGTKSMSAAAVFAAIISRFDLLEVVSGDRSAPSEAASGNVMQGIVKKGTEKVIAYKTAKLIAEIELEQELLPLFDSYLFSKMGEKLEKIKEELPSARIDVLIKLARAYDYWDKFDYEKAWKALDKEEICKILKEEKLAASMNLNALGGNDNFLKELNDKMSGRDPDRYRYFLADLINNACRRGEEGKYDDAVARMYRAIEMLAEYRLENAGVDLNKKFDLGALKDQSKIEKWKEELTEDGKLKIALGKKFDLLKDLGDESYKIYDDNELRDLLNKRNVSKLAHGDEPITKEIYEKMHAKVDAILKEKVNKFEDLKRRSTFLKAKDIGSLIDI